MTEVESHISRDPLKEEKRMRRFKDLTAADFPDMDPQKVQEWMEATRTANTYTMVLLLALVLVNVVLYLTTGSIMLGGLLLLLPLFFIWRKPRQLEKELGMTRRKVKDARMRTA